MRTSVLDGLFGMLLVAVEIVVIFVYGFYFNHVNDGDSFGVLVQKVSEYFPYFQDLHILVFVGFALLLTSYHRFRISSMVQCFWVCALSVQMYFLWRSFWYERFEKEGVFYNKHFFIDPAILIRSDLCALAMLISTTATAGKANDIQVLVLVILGVGFYSLNETVCLSKVSANAIDIGGSMIVHTFGAFYGLGASMMLRYNNISFSKPSAPTSFQHQIVTLIGTLFIWCFWPSYNCALVASETDTFRAILNTYFALISSVVFSFATSKLIIGGGKFSMYHVFHASLSGGVVMAASAGFVKDGYAAYLVGALVGIISTFCIHVLNPMLERMNMTSNIPHICLHAIPGLLGGFLSAIWVKAYTDMRAGNQVGATFISLGIGLLAGAIVGLIIKPLHNDEQNEQYQGFAPIALEETEEEVLRVSPVTVGVPQPAAPVNVYTEANPQPEHQELKA